MEKDPCFHRRQPKRCRSRGTGVDEEDEKEQQLQSRLSPPCVKRKRLLIRGRETNTVILPEDMIHSEILPRLPTKYILRCRLVCKSWYSRFSTPSFVKSHLMRQHHHPPDDEEEDLVIFKLKAGMAIRILSRTAAIHVGSVPYVRDTLLGSINGLIALSCLEGKRFCLWNPAVAQFKYFPMPPPPHHHPPSKKDHHCIHFVGGFCWDRVQDDYKVLLFCYHSSTSTPSQLCIYSSNSSTWTQLPIPAPAQSMLPAGTIFEKSQIISPPSTIVKGIPYWSYIKYLNLPGYKRRRKFISTFKFLPQINEFRFLPDLDSRKTRKNTFQIVNIKDHLVGMAYNFDLGKSYSVDIYSLGDHESQSSGVWRKMYTVGPVGHCYINMRLSQCFKNGGEILIYGPAGPLYVYHPKTNETKVHESSTSNLLKTCFSYIPSLVCVPGMELMQGSFKESPTICNRQSGSVEAQV